MAGKSATNTELGKVSNNKRDVEDYDDDDDDDLDSVGSTVDYINETRDLKRKTIYHDSNDLVNGRKQETSIEEDEVDHIVTDAGFAFRKQKAAAEGMMDIALLTANANQLRFIIVYGQKTMTFYVVAVLIGFSLILQVLVGIGIIFRRLKKSSGNREMAKRIKNYITGAIFLITIVNVFAASFTTTDTPIVKLIGKS